LEDKTVGQVGNLPGDSRLQTCQAIAGYKPAPQSCPVVRGLGDRVDYAGQNI
jgi:hypothetical protein